MPHVNFLNAESPRDYISVANLTRLIFLPGAIRACHDFGIIDDDICEDDPNEYFFSSLEFAGGEQPITVDPSLAEIIIDDTNQLECGEWLM